MTHGWTETQSDFMIGYIYILLVNIYLLWLEFQFPYDSNILIDCPGSLKVSLFGPVVSSVSPACSFFNLGVVLKKHKFCSYFQFCYPQNTHQS